MNNATSLDLGQLLMRLKMLTVTQFARPMREKCQSTLPAGDHTILICLMEHRGTAISMTELAKETLVSKPNLTAAVNRLCEEGMVERIPDPKDRRVMALAITGKGIEFLKAQRKQTMEFLKNKLSLLDEADQQKMQRALTDLTEVLLVLREKEQEKDQEKDQEKEQQKEQGESRC